MRHLHSAAPKTLNLHRALSHGGRPMSMHQAMTMTSIYGDPMLPTNRHTMNASPTLRNNRPGSTAASIALSDIQKSSESKQKGNTVARNVASIRSILRTVWPDLSAFKRGQLILGFVSALVHAAGPPSFSYFFSQLLRTFFIKEDARRLHALERVLDQPKAWLNEEENGLAGLTSCLDHNAGEMRNLVSRFAPFIVIVAAMTTIAIVWSLIECWKLTLVGIAVAPSLYFVTKDFEAVSSKFENLTDSAGNEAGSIFVETFTNIRTARALSRESYFHKKYNKATSKVWVVSIKRAAYYGFFFGASDSTINFVTALVF
jgi:ATP-binding cassette, subfamily B (MDR/TAP), member 1